jgi:acetyl esterase/lipase
MLPLVRQSPSNSTPILGSEDAAQFLSAYLGNMTMDERKFSMVSPAYSDLKGLTTALFLIGTEDPLIEDTLLMHFKWVRAGNHAVVKFVPSACHGFMTFDGAHVEATRHGWEIMIQFLREQD